MTKLEICKIFQDVIADIHLIGEYETDSRDIWPKRWAVLKNRLIANIEDNHKCNCEVKGFTVYHKIGCRFYE